MIRWRPQAALCTQEAYTSGVSTGSDLTRKDARLVVRLTPDQDSVIREAASAAGQSLTEFVLAAGVSRAEDTLADRRVFRLHDDAWSEFTAILDRPAERLPALAARLNQPTPWDE